MAQPYTYVIGWRHLNMWYIGARWADGCRSSDLWDTYFTSSKYVDEFREAHGEPDVVRVLGTYDSKKGALGAEILLQTEADVAKNERFLNKSIAGYFDPADPEIRKKIAESRKGYVPSLQTREKNGAAHRGKITSLETRRKMSEAAKGKVQSPEHRAAVSRSLLGNTCRRGTNTSPEGRENMRVAHLGLKASDETKAKMSLARKGLVYDTVTCPYCGKSGRESGMRSWHFDHCSHNPKGSRKCRSTFPNMSQ